MINLTNLLAFIIELPFDWYRINVQDKQDSIRGKHRALIVAATLSFSIIWHGGFTEWGEFFKFLAGGLSVAFMPYCFFDILLNKMRGLKWYHLGQKKWDRVLSKVNIYALLTARVVAFIGLLIIFIITL